MSREEEHSAAFRARRVQNWVFLGLMYGFFYMSRYNFSAIAARVSDAFGWSNTQYGTILTAGTLVYGCSVFLNGPIADRLGGKRAILIGSAGAAVFNLAFGLCHLFLLRPARLEHGTVVEAAQLADGMTASTVIATMAAIWAANHYFQSFGALSIVKINAAWFRVGERGTFAGIFGIMIQGGRWLAFAMSPFILRFLPWQYCFFIPAAILAVMWFLNLRFVQNSPSEAGFPELDTGDETKEEQATAATLGFVLRKVFANRTTWTIALASMCIGMVRNSIDHWWAKYFSTVFEGHAGGPFQFASFAMPAFAIAGGLSAGIASDRFFGSRRAPVICFGFLGQLACLLLLSQTLRSAWAGALLLASISFFIQAAHSMVGGAASMDFGGKKAVATAAGLFDGAQYLAGAIVGRGMGQLLDHYKDRLHPGVEYDFWPLAPAPFAVIGALLIARLWNARPGRGGHGGAPATSPSRAASPSVGEVSEANPG